MSWKPEADEIAQRHRHAEALGGEESVRRHREGGKLTVRERIAQLTDPGSFQEVGKLAGQGSYTPDGVLQSVRPMPYVMGLAKIDGRPVALKSSRSSLNPGETAPPAGKHSGPAVKNPTPSLSTPVTATVPSLKSDDPVGEGKPSASAGSVFVKVAGTAVLLDDDKIDTCDGFSVPMNSKVTAEKQDFVSCSE